MKSKKGIIFISLGLALIIGAFSLKAYNKYEEKRAGEESSQIFSQLDGEIEEKEVDPEPAYKVEKEIVMPTVVIDGYEYIGTLKIPALDLSLPVMSTLDYPLLKKSPCRYRGSVYTDDMIIGAHNYNTHFGRLKNLNYGDKIIFTDTDKNVFEYKIISIETLDSYAMDELLSGDWDLTLFTCTIGGRTRVTVRCAKLNED